MAARWLRTPEVVRWWGDPQEQIVLMTEDLDEPLMRQSIVEHQGRPFAYVQTYPAHAWPQPHLMHLREGAQAIDAFIGEPNMLRRGHQVRFCARWPRIYLPRVPASLRLIPTAIIIVHAARTLEPARRNGMVETAAGPAVLMLFS